MMSSHRIEQKWKSDDGEARDRWGRLIKVCGVGGCTYKMGGWDMKQRKASRHGIGPKRPSQSKEAKAERKRAADKKFKVNLSP